MKKILLTFFILLSTSLGAEMRIVENFSSYRPDKFPTSFHTYPFQRGKAMRVYTVKEEDHNRYLQAKDDQDISVQVFKRFPWEPSRSPYFSWRWRAKILPKGAAENNPATNDCACGIYVIFGGYTGNVIKYTWSSTLPVGTVVEKKPGQSYSVILESGPKNLRTWKTESVNVLEDYHRLFKSSPSNNPPGFGILTDGNATHSTAACDYDDFKISGSTF